MTDKIKRSLDFVVRFYRPDAFRPDGWFIEKPLPFWRRHAAAAAVIAVALAAAAAVTTYITLHTDPPAKIETAPAEPIIQEPAEERIEEPKPEKPHPIVKKIEFDDAPLPEVVKAIEETYNVNVTGATQNQPPLTLSYQGTADDLVATINDLLGTNLKIEK